MVHYPRNCTTISSGVHLSFSPTHSSLSPPHLYFTMQPISPHRVQHISTFLLTYLLSSCLPATARGLPNVPRPANPFLDPKNDPYNPLGYIASNTLTGVAFSVYNQIILHLHIPNGRKVSCSLSPSCRLSICGNGVHGGWCA